MNRLHFLMMLLPVVFMLHDFEEIILFKLWLGRNRHRLASRFPRVARMMERLGLFELSTAAFAVAVCHEFVLLSLAALGGIYFESWHWWFAAFMAFFLHLLIHIVQWFMYRGYVPVIVTSVLFLPYCGYTLSLFLDAHWLTPGQMLLWTGIGVLVMLLSFPFAFFCAWRFERFVRADAA